MYVVFTANHKSRFSTIDLKKIYLMSIPTVRSRRSEKTLLLRRKQNPDMYDKVVLDAVATRKVEITQRFLTR